MSTMYSAEQKREYMKYMTPEYMSSEHCMSETDEEADGDLTHHQLLRLAPEDWTPKKGISSKMFLDFGSLDQCIQLALWRENV